MSSIPKSPPSCVLVLTGDGLWIDIDGDPYEFDFEEEFDDFCEQYLDETSPSFEEEKAFYCADLKC